MMGYYLATHPHWQDRLRAESRALGTDTLAHPDLDTLVGMDMVFRETLRMNAPAGMIARKATKDTAIDGYHVPRGSQIVLAMYPTHRMEPWWKDPDTFDPERFGPARHEDSWHKYAWAPFGGSVHKCIGMHFGAMQIKAVMHQLLLRYRLSVPRGYAPAMDYGTGPFPADGLPVHLHAI
jgi:cytochrome P450